MLEWWPERWRRCVPKLSLTPKDLPSTLGGPLDWIMCTACGVHPGAVKVVRSGRGRKVAINTLCAICRDNFLHATKKDPTPPQRKAWNPKR